MSEIQAKTPQESKEDAPGTSSTSQPSSDNTTKSDSGKKLSNKELKELKKQEKAAKRAAKKQANGITIEEQQKIALLKKEKKQQQRDQQLKQQKKEQEKKNQKNAIKTKAFKKNTLFGHLETTEERRATMLTLTGAFSASRASKVTAHGLVVPMVTNPISNTNVLTTTALGTPVPTPTVNQNDSSIETQSTAELARSLAAFALENDQFQIVQGMSSVIPNSIENNMKNSLLTTSVKELLLNKDLVHPAVISLTYQLSNYKIVGSIPRCIAMLEAFQIVINDYQTPQGTTLSRNLTNYLSHQIDILKKARPLSVTMGNAIRWLKQEISHIDPNMSDKVAKRELCDQIAQFAREKIELADQLILDNASNHIKDGTTILTYGSSKVLTEMIIHNVVDLKKDVKVVVVDSRPLFEGRKMATYLRSRGVDVMYALITSLNNVLKMPIDYVFLGAHSILSNGFLYSRAGTAMIAMSAKRRNIPVLVCCESLKFSQRVQLDSVTFNELADSNDLVNIDYENPIEKRGSQGALLKQFIKERTKEKEKIDLEINKQKGKQSNSNQSKNNGNNNNGNNSNDSTDQKNGESNNNNNNKNILDDWQDIPSLNIVNILYDLTPPEYIKKIITEFGALPPSSVPVILREYKGSV
ncbi:hypothetical protein TBLA_0C02430 [Henningerozyma blattae CBS 6284]|uniref:Translation initiation factor eIF2B subunit delta n=1 Tax=Henningerozyma blattae (strain ATCC 34711 / CBS 6284 / DSM 70876 / NBRC 10599 / NRRL Y-10934 / UCD 77-7) TaxID=1071380 RepID=I2H101_HENB6|nr:hypothetical protein TBLA_0C02430 [Tetrapisispora blattae CBS 6284]CCH60053.1 hypothetical protein TBLA_0C02430 [Tetrapisispora blattae CBS 6284]